MYTLNHCVVSVLNPNVWPLTGILALAILHFRSGFRSLVKVSIMSLELSNTM